jgi:uncharacterized protein (DUF488 family)
MKIYTVGHSSHQLDYFIELLKTHSIDCIVDVRSVAYSRFPQFCKEQLATSLKQRNVYYLHFQDEFGARRKERALLTDGIVDFQKVRSSAPFQRGVERLKNGAAKGFTIALMCAESNPLDCHRFGMICPALSEFEILHILRDKTTKTNSQLERDLVKKYKSSDITTAYKLLNKKIGYKP